MPSYIPGVQTEIRDNKLDCEIWGSHSLVDEDQSILGCNTMQIGKQLPSFRMRWLPPAETSVESATWSLKKEAPSIPET